MTLTDLLADEELRQHEFPVSRDGIFLAHAGVCPLPRRVVTAISDYAREASAGDQEKVVYPSLLQEGRKLAAQLLRCESDEIAFVGPTSHRKSQATQTRVPNFLHRAEKSVQIKMQDGLESTFFAVVRAKTGHF